MTIDADRIRTLAARLRLAQDRDGLLPCDEAADALDALLAEREAQRERLAALVVTSDPDARMNAYYYWFDSTGIRIIDAVLSAVARAGKAYHHTESWDDDEYPPSQRDRIQKAAQDAADAIRLAASTSDPEPEAQP